MYSLPTAWEPRTMVSASANEIDLPCLFTATLRIEHDEFEIVIFHACHALDRSEVVAAVAARSSTLDLTGLVVVEGIDGNDPIVRRLVKGEVLSNLVNFGDCRATFGPLAAGGALHIVEQADL